MERTTQTSMSMTHDTSNNGSGRSNNAPRCSLDFEHDDTNKKAAPLDAPNDSSGGTTVTGKQQQQQNQQKFRLRSLTANAPFRFCLRTNDEIHQSIDLCPVLQTFVDTPQMQRLRYISQLGTSQLVFMNANHNRFEHSLGVAHLAERMCKRIMDRQGQGSALQCITKKDVLCIKLAGLLHDIGHGPFSHVYEEFITKSLPRHLNKQKQQQNNNDENITSHDDDNDSNDDNDYYASLPPIPNNWKHECVSLMMIDAALEYLGLQIDLSRLDEPLKQIGDGIDARSMRVFDISLSSSLENNHHDVDDDDNILTSRDFIFIKECIWGQPLPEVQEYFLRENQTTNALATASDESSLSSQKAAAAFSIGFVGRPNVEKEWLYDIVSNRHSGLDVDKIDYFARDERRAFGGAGEIDKVMIEEAFVAWGKCTNPDTCSRCQCGRKRSTPNTSPSSTAAAVAATSTMTPSHGRFNDMEVDHNTGGSSSSIGRHLMICYPTKMVKATMGFFTKRFSLHSKVYQHKTTAAVGHQITDILCLADPYFYLPTTLETGMSMVDDIDNNNLTSSTRAKTKLDHAFLPCSRAMLDASVMLRCRDSIIDQIANTTDPKLEPARLLVHRFWKRDLYKCVATKHINMKDPTDCAIWQRQEEDIVREMMAFGGRHDKTDNDSNKSGEGQQVVALHEDDFIVERCSMHHGCKDKNPLSKMRFLPKHLMHKLVAAHINDLPEAIEVDESTYEALLPRLLQENSIRVYSVHSSKRDLVSHVFSAWLDHIKSQHGLDSSVDAINTTPELEKERQEQAAAMLSQDSDFSGTDKNENGKTPRPSDWSSVVSPPLQKQPRISDIN